MMGKRKWWIAAIVVVGLLLVWVVVRHTETEADNEKPGGPGDGAEWQAVVKVERGNLGSPLTLAGAFKPFQDVDVHAKVAGYIKEIYVDVGSHVKAGTNPGDSRSAGTRSGISRRGCSEGALKGRSGQGAKRFAGSEVDATWRFTRCTGG